MRRRNLLTSAQRERATRWATSDEALVRHYRLSVTASLVLRRLGAYPQRDNLAKALRELGRLERTLFTLDWLEDPLLRRRASRELNKGEARNSLARAVCFHRLGKFRDRSYDNQRYRASGLNLVAAAIILWNTTYLHRAVSSLERYEAVDPSLLRHISPPGWEHINLTGDYLWGPQRRPTLAISDTFASLLTWLRRTSVKYRPDRVLGPHRVIRPCRATTTAPYSHRA